MTADNHAPPALASGNTVLRVTDLGKEYRLYATPRQRLKSLLSSSANNYQSHWALRDVSFELRRGQCIGVIGDNGAGKSSLLKLLAGTLQPTCGTVERVGRVTAILELGAGFHPDFSGRDNLYFGGSLIGISQEEMARLEPGIVEFSELGEALNRPVKTYSSGMAVRLAFALVTAVQPDLLIIDEALAVGDQHFQKKCVERILAFRENGCTILFCSHSPYHIRQLCDVALWLDGGRVQELGATEAVLAAYEMHTRLRAGDTGTADTSTAAADDTSAATDDTPPPQPAPPAPRPASAAHIVSVDLANLSASGDPQTLESRDLVATIVVRGQCDERPNIGFMIEQSHGVGITSLATHEEGAAPTRLADGNWQSVLTFPDLPLHSGQYVVSAYLFDASGLVVYDEWYQFLHFRFVTPTLMPGLVRLPHHWS
ncbi:MAG TPA: ABC transporter ATP-binding protein [Burkholderiaceae bacterium]